MVKPIPDHRIGDSVLSYGERGGRVRDPFGHHWMVSQVIEDVSHAEMERRVQELFS